MSFAVHRIAAPMALLALLTGCGRCHGWDEVEVVDPQGLDEGGQLDALRVGIDRFVTWTGRDQTCVDRVRLVDELSSHGRPLSGRYSSVSQRISVKASGSLGWLSLVTEHELCHSLDHEEGSPSLDAADLLEPYTVNLDTDIYRTDHQRTREAFANICEAGPTLPSLWRQVEASCGVQVDDAAVGFVHEVAFSGADSVEEMAPFSWDELSTPVRGVDLPAPASSPGQLVGGADGLYYLELEVQGEGDEAPLVPVIHRLHAGRLAESLARARRSPAAGRDLLSRLPRRRGRQRLRARRLAAAATAGLGAGRRHPRRARGR